MGSVISLIIILVLSILITRVATIALTHTGLSHQAAKFQARSAFTGVGFTTREAESITEHPVRRRVVMTLMLLGNVGIVSAVSSLILTFAGGREGQLTDTASLLIIGGSIVLLWLLSRSRWVDQGLEKLINYSLRKYTDLTVRDYHRLLNLSGEYQITEIKVEPDDWMAGHSLAELALRDEGIVVLGIKRQDGSFIGVPYGETNVEAGDTLTVYGREEGLRELDKREQGASGDREHRQASDKNQTVRQEEEAADQRRKERQAAS